MVSHRQYPEICADPTEACRDAPHPQSLCAENNKHTPRMALGEKENREPCMFGGMVAGHLLGFSIADWSMLFGGFAAIGLLILVGSRD
jgi:predicted lipid-binding transport protein (Tim44 family)